MTTLPRSVLGKVNGLALHNTRPEVTQSPDKVVGQYAVCTFWVRTQFIRLMINV